MYWIFTNRLENFEEDTDISGDISYIIEKNISFKTGASLEGISIPKITLETNEYSRFGRMTDHLVITETRGLVFSSRLIRLLTELKLDNIDYFDFEIVSPQTEEKFADYKIANVVGLVDCVDKEKSELTYFDDGDIEFIDKLVLDETKIPPDLNIFRLSNDPITLIVHNDIKEAIEKARITGCVFCKPEDYVI